MVAPAVGWDSPCVQDQDAAAAMGQIQRDLKTIHRATFTDDQVQFFAQPWNVPRAAIRRVIENALGILRRDLQVLDERSIHPLDPSL